jgi:methylenetetrahydrofolate reductase (NADPH)
MSERTDSRFSSWLDGFLSARPLLERCVSGFGLLLENAIKIPVFRCQRCGECVLSRTAFICSQRCPKRLRNGACGGTRPDGFCEVYPDKRCIWYAIYARSRTLRRVPMLTEMLPPHMWDLEHTAAWLNVFRGRESAPVWFVRSVADRLDFRLAERAEEERKP